MAFSTCIRFTASSLLLRRQLRLSFPVLSFKPRPVLCNLRFLSGVSRRTPSVRAVRAKRREDDGDEGIGGDSGNGSLLVKEEKVGEGRIAPTELHKEATEAYMSYAMSVLLGRSLPDVRDGLKPVHRRILFAMHELGISSRKPFKKCARVVGEVLGKFHPHGDNAVYDSLVRMAQDFSLRFPLIQGHGNFGSIDAGPPAAMRYTECRLEALTEAMLLADLEQNTVDFVPNFDNSQNEPSLLPARVPNLLLNGSSGIAVGMATNIPPHNLGELVDVLSVLIHNPDATIPYQTNKSALVEKIAHLVENKSLEGISDIRDESDRSGMRMAIELKRGSDPSIVLNNLYRLTSLQSSFSCNMAFLDFRCSVIERRAKFKLSQAQDRKHIVEGIIIGLDNLDGVIQLIKANSSLAMASAALKKEYDLSSKQAEALLDITLRKLTFLERKKFINECESVSDEISKLNELLSSKKNILELIEQEAVDLKNRFSTPRRSMLEDAEGGQLEDIDVIPNEEMLLALSEKGYMKRMKPNTINLQHRGTIGRSVGKMRVNDTMSDFIVGHAHDHVLYFSDRGIVYSARAYKIPECTRTAAGTPLVQILALSDGERITSVIPVSKFVEDQYLIMLTVNGYIKKVSLNFFSAIRSTGIIAIQLVPGDELKWVRRSSNDDLIAMASQNGMVILSSCKTVRALGRNTRGKEWGQDGIHGHNTSNYAERSTKGVGGLPPDVCLSAVFVVGFSLAEDGESDEQLVLASQSGTINRIKVQDISVQSRYARGVILMRVEHAGKIQSTSLISAADVEVGADD
ncbi:hypothetical protein MRB53_014875 [Persea americana]|uniref:Uncharacterized protein n=1 Tax=Persea americana TaxID=3435 RepID=A0ACC2KCK7_PERAE|nr:hypothetical protein MRB53_014875 [Persea americana]